MTNQRPPLPFADLERIYEKLATAIDAAGPERECVMLAKLVLALAHELGDAATTEQCIDRALQDLTDTRERRS